MFVWKKFKSSIKYQMYSCQDLKSEVWAKNLKNYGLLPMVENLHFYFKHPVSLKFIPFHPSSSVVNVAPSDFAVSVFLFVPPNGGQEDEQNPQFPCPWIYSWLSFSLVGHQKLPVLISLKHFSCNIPSSLKGNWHIVFGFLGLSFAVKHSSIIFVT